MLFKKIDLGIQAAIWAWAIIGFILLVSENKMDQAIGAQLYMGAFQLFSAFFTLIFSGKMAKKMAWHLYRYWALVAVYFFSFFCFSQLFRSVNLDKLAIIYTVSAWLLAIYFTWITCQLALYKNTWKVKTIKGQTETL